MDNKDLTQLLNAENFAGKHDQVYPIVYNDLHNIAENLFRRERENHTLQPTMLLNEAYMNLVDKDHINYNGRSHFYAVGAQAIRKLLVDHARKRNAVKRGSGAYKVDLEENQAFSVDDGNLLEIDEVLGHLAKLHERQAKVVELKFFGGFKMQEIADELGVSLKTIELDWKIAKAWLKQNLSR